MTEQEWLACNDPTPMLEFLADNVSARKARLFGCACCQRMWNLLSRRGRQAIATAEQYADGEVSAGKLKKAHHRAWLSTAVDHDQPETAERVAMRAIDSVCETYVNNPVRYLLYSVEYAAR